MEPETEAIRRPGLPEVVGLTEPDDDGGHSPGDPSFFQVMSRLRAGDKEAAAEVFRRFVTRLIALASHQFEARLRGKADPEDVVQSVYKSFFRRDDRLPYKLSDWEALWALLAAITVRKCRDRREFWRAARRDPNREAASGHDPEAEAWWEAVEKGPTPLQATILADTLEQLLRPLDPRDRVIAEMSFQGYTADEIADRCDCSERTVRRVMTRIRTRIREIEAADPLG
jgi:RNA polymerase sigma-70 factor (ECF subfamily)